VRKSSRVKSIRHPLLYDRCLSDKNYCPSGFNELRPARRISSVDSRFMAMTELYEVRSWLNLGTAISP
jgi:hypothetical protein